MQIAALTVEIFARVLERCNVKCEVLGFTTREWDGGEPGREWAAAGYPENPGRLNALEHIGRRCAVAARPRRPRVVHARR
jgi:cobaltochelatase CobT